MKVLIFTANARGISSTRAKVLAVALEFFVVVPAVGVQIAGIIPIALGLPITLVTDVTMDSAMVTGGSRVLAEAWPGDEHRDRDDCREKQDRTHRQLGLFRIHHWPLLIRARD